jgi:hypothetical protein
LGPRDHVPDWRHAHDVTFDAYYRQLKEDARAGKRIRVKYDEAGFPYGDPEGEAVPLTTLCDEDHRAITRAQIRHCVEFGINRYQRNEAHVQR